MELVNPMSMLWKAKLGGYAIGAFNIHNQETLQAVAETANKERAPLILQTTPGTVKHNGADMLFAMASVMAKRVSVPVALHLDHATDLAVVWECIDAGYTSVMFDGSRLPWDEHLELMRQVVARAHSKGIAVEGELGRIGGSEEDLHVEEDKAFFTMPEQAATFAEVTGIDTLAVAIGTAHGIYKRKPHLDFDRLQVIAARVSLPLVLHGGSGIPEEDIALAVRLGISKINIATELKIAFADALRKSLADDPDENDPRRYLADPCRSVKEVVAYKMKLFGVAGQAG